MQTQWLKVLRGERSFVVAMGPKMAANSNGQPGIRLRFRLILVWKTLNLHFVH